ncbi:hypothetical protein ABIF65_011557 [Bradyrhizobium japonicum]|jgi:hypothetical protein|uniref:Uncharacterized protein n=1 Tax=Bradyrhizobium japonicum TaxID=375 RepID=A0ABV2RGI4_BRAJP|nr:MULTISPECIES: hypothetical protein [Bradyrhizobium]MCP1768437.1 hypothetical protein [Bradyrhizobium japonicum]MCP1794598.1 hypothetical protein [Bradyrhizobium japonicum]MCP1811136.1 hypothetical protein [Bradyrhizobium japonicum]MCP1821011.1 hypothetical protein [Bradyrhizobium japonicum]MCP1876047.1 hypothetical protein [Bradyrhizobium japonicum]
MLNWMVLALESNRVIGLRIAKLMRGGKAAQREAHRMVSEKMLAAAKASTSLMAGASGARLSSNIEERWRQTPNGSVGSERANENRAEFAGSARAACPSRSLR